MPFLNSKHQVRLNLTPLSLRAPKTMAVAKISCIYLKKQRFWNNGTCILPEICHKGVQNVKLGQIRPPHFNGLKKT